MLFHEFLLPFEITSVLILIAIMGAVVSGQQAARRLRRASKEGGLMVPLSYYLVLSGFLFACGVPGFLIKRNIITIFMSIELMLNGVNLSFVAFAAHWHALAGRFSCSSSWWWRRRKRPWAWRSSSRFTARARL